MSASAPYTVMFSAGEASGDQHAAHMYLEMKKLCPDLQSLGMGGRKMADAGIDVRVDSSQIAVIGVVEVVKHYPEIRRALKTMQHLLAEKRPDLLVCVDYKEFNFKLAAYANKLGIKVLFYVSPQVWAWRPGRVKKYGQIVDAMAVIFPFEVPYYEVENVPVRYVGHPSVDKVHPNYTKSEDFVRYGLVPSQPVVGLLPGSRNGEIKRMLPVMLQAAVLIKNRLPDAQFILPQAVSISDHLLQTFIADLSIPLKVVKNEPYDVMQCCDVIMTTSGTASLELALFNIPMVVCYRLSGLTYWLGRLLVKTPFIGLPNIIAGKSIVKELIQHEANGGNLAEEVCRILTDSPYAERIRADLKIVKEKLGAGGGSKNTALLALELLAKGRN